MLAARAIESGPHLRIAFGRAKAHHDVIGFQQGIEPRAEQYGEIERGEGTLADDYWMNEFDGDVLCVGDIRALSEREQAAAAKEALGHFAAGGCQARCLAHEEELVQLVAC